MFELSDQAARNRLSLPKKPAVGGRPVRLNRQIASSSAISRLRAAEAAKYRHPFRSGSIGGCSPRLSKREHADRHQAVRRQVEQHAPRRPPTGTASPTARPTSM